MATKRSARGAKRVTVQRVREAWAARPFRPFRLRLSDGSAVLVRHPEFLAMSPSGRVLTVYQPDDSQTWVDILLVSALEFGPARPPWNGPRRG